MKPQEIYSVSITWPDTNDRSRLGPYFGLTEAKSQAVRAKNKGATINSIDIGYVTWQEHTEFM